MRAVVITAPGDADVLQLQDRPLPVPGPGQVRVRVAATALNRADLLQRRGRYPAPPDAPNDIPGLEYAGVVDALGEGVEDPRVGARVMGLVGGGAYAEAVVANAAETIPVPTSLSLEDAAAVPEAFLTAHDALFTLLRLQPGSFVLIHAVGSGVGTAGLQLALAFGARPLGTGRTAWKLERASKLGLELAIDVGQQDWAEAVLEHTGGEGVSAVLDLVGGDYLRGDLRVLRTLGRIAVVGLVAGRSTELDLRALLDKRARVIGTVMRARSSAEKAQVAERFRADALPLFESGRLRPIVDRVLPIGEVAAAHRAMEANTNFGKIVLRWE